MFGLNITIDYKKDRKNAVIEKDKKEDDKKLRMYRNTKIIP